VENNNFNNLSEKLEKEFSQSFPINDIHIISLKVTARKAIVITIMKKGGVTIDDCKFVSSYISKYIPDDYDLQVQSPGIGLEIRPDSFNILNLFIQTPIKVFYNDEKEGKNIVKEVEGILTFIDKFVCLKEFDITNKKNKKNQKYDAIEDEKVISIQLEKIIKIKTIFYPEEL